MPRLRGRLRRGGELHRLVHDVPGRRQEAERHGLRSIVGGKVEAYVSMCEVARAEALQYCLEHAREKGANAILGMRYDANEVDQGMTEVLAYGTAVVLEPKVRPAGSVPLVCDQV